MNIQQIIAQLGRGARVTFEQLLRDVLAPAHFRGKWSQRWLGTIGAFVELIYQGTQEAVDVGFAGRCPNDALDEVGFNLNIERLFAEADGPYRDRLRHPFRDWHESGTVPAIPNRYSDIGLTGGHAYDMAAGWDPGDANTYSFGRFWLVLYPPHPWSLLFADDDVIASEDLVAGVEGMTQTDYRNLRRLAHKWRTAHSAPVTLFIVFSGTLASLSTADAMALVAAEDAVDLPMTRPYAGDTIYASDYLLAGWFIEPL